MQPYLYIIRLRSSVGVRPFTLDSIFLLSDTFRSRGYTSFFPIVKKRHNRQNMNSLRGNFTVNRLLCLLRTLPEINCDWLVHVGARKTYDLLSAELPLFSPDESLYFRRMKSTTRVITTTKKTLPTGKMTWATVWATTRERPSYHAIRDRGHAKDDGGTARETIAYGRSRRVQILTARLSTHC